MDTTGRKTKKKLTPKEYLKVISSIDLQEIYLESSSTSVIREEIFKTKQLGVSIGEKAKLERIDDKYSVCHNYELTVPAADSPDKNILRITATFRLVFSSNIKIEEDFFSVFKKANLRINTWPYFREFVQNSTQRMHIPPLTLPFFKGFPKSSKT